MADLFYGVVLLTLKHQSIKLVGQENVSGQRCNKYRLIHSKSIGRYKISYAWVSRKFGILLRVTAYDQHGQPLQQIQITDLKKRNGQLQPLRIRFDAINPETNKFEKTSYLKLRSKLK